MRSSAGTNRSARKPANNMALASRDFRSLRLDGISREFGHMRALSDVSLTVQRGEFIALLRARRDAASRPR